jgi:hypothetical protein
MRGGLTPIAAGVLATLVAGCSVIGAGEITVTARNGSDEPMIVQVIQGVEDDGPVHGESFTVAPSAIGQLALQVPGGSWTVEVNGQPLLSTSDTAGRVGELPVTLSVGPDGFVSWEAPTDWVEAGR